LDETPWGAPVSVMAGRVPAIHALLTGHADDRRMGGWVYIMSNKRNGTLYIGVTNDLIRRVWEHREGTGSSFVRWYSLTWLAYFEHHDDNGQLSNARAWKVRLLAAQIPDWQDLYPALLG
jgi:putative endonuclease